MTKLLKLHHSAYRCKDTEKTREFYESFLNLKLVKVLEIETTKTKRKTNVLHTFYQLKDGSCIAFFEEPDQEFNFKKQRDFDLHIAFEVKENDLYLMYNIREYNLYNIILDIISTYSKSIIHYN